jgi:type IV secretion system protein VirB9
MKSLICLFLLLFPVTALAAESGQKPGAGNTPGGNAMPDVYFSISPELSLNAQERAGLELVRKWNADASKAVKPVSGGDGSVQYLFGASQPGIVCAVLQITDIELQAGEKVNSLHYGDTARWLIEPAISGAGMLETQHLIVKPKDVGMVTSLVVATNKRTYHMQLKSTLRDYMPKVSFVYPDSVMAKWDAMKMQQDAQVKRDTMPDTREYLGDLDFGYEISGSAKWKPVRVYNDGVKTMIQMPREMRQTEAPALLVVRGSGVFGRENVMVNYRLQGDRYIVDSLFDRAILIAGVGMAQDKITIKRVKKG